MSLPGCFSVEKSIYLVREKMLLSRPPFPPSIVVYNQKQKLLNGQIPFHLLERGRSSFPPIQLISFPRLVKLVRTRNSSVLFVRSILQFISPNSTFYRKRVNWISFSFSRGILPQMLMRNQLVAYFLLISIPA